MAEASTASENRPETRPFLAIGLRLVAMLAVSIMFACVKWASERGVHIVETLFYRQLLGMPVAIAGVMMGPGISALRTRHIGLHISRATLGTIGMVLNFGGYILLPLAEATTIGFTMPIFATLLSVFFLGERPGIHRWAAVIAGFLGVLAIVGPGRHEGLAAFGVSVAIGASIATACVSLVLRRIGRIEHPAVVVFYFTLLPLPLLAAAMLWFGKAHDLETWGILTAMGLFGGIAQLLMTGALKWGPVSLVLPMDYSSLLWSTALGWFIWHSWPGSSTWVGAAIIVGSSLYILWREHVNHRASLDREISVN